MQPQPTPGLQPGVMPPPMPYDPRSQINTPLGQPQPPQMAPGYGNAPPSPVYGGDQRVSIMPVRDYQRPMEQPPQPYIDSIMPVPEQDTPVQYAPTAPSFYNPPMMSNYETSPYSFSRPGRDRFMDDFNFGMR